MGGSGSGNLSLGWVKGKLVALGRSLSFGKELGERFVCVSLPPTQ